MKMENKNCKNCTGKLQQNRKGVIFCSYYCQRSFHRKSAVWKKFLEEIDKPSEIVNKFNEWLNEK